MLPLPASRVAVVDDTPREIEGLVQALKRHQIYPLYSDGTVEKLPDEPLKGLRLFILDIILNPGVQTTDQAQNVFNKLVPERPGPYVLVIWTYNVDLKEEFDQFIDGQRQRQPLATLYRRKAEYSDSNGGFDFERLRMEIQEELANVGPFALMLDWENEVVDAADKVLTQLNSLIRDTGAGDSGALLLETLLRAGGGKAINVESAKESVPILYDILHRIHRDVLQKDVADPSPVATTLAEQLRNAGGGDLDPALKAKVQSYLVLNSGGPDSDKTLPGDVYKLTFGEGNSWDPKDFLHAILDGRSPQSGVVDRCVASLIRDDDLLTPVLVELTPLCDVAQQKNLGHRCAGGVLVHDSLWGSNRSPLGQRGGSQYDLADFWLRGTDSGIYYLIVDFRFLCMAASDRFSSEQPLLRLRDQIMVDMQAHLGSHASRPGIVALN